MSKPLPEVDFCENVNLQLTYKQNIYDVKLLYSASTLTIIFCDSGGSIDGLMYRIDSDICNVSYNGITHNISSESLPESFLAKVIYKFISDFGGVIPTENYNTQNVCSYISRHIYDCDVTLEVYENENNIAYSLSIT